MEAGEYDKAIKQYEEALRYRPEFTAARNNLAMALEFDGRRLEAEGVYVRALRDSPAEPSLHLNYGLFLEADGRFEDARGHYYTFVTLSQDDVLTALVRERLGLLR